MVSLCLPWPLATGFMVFRVFCLLSSMLCSRNGGAVVCCLCWRLSSSWISSSTKCPPVVLVVFPGNVRSPHQTGRLVPCTWSIHAGTAPRRATTLGYGTRGSYRYPFLVFALSPVRCSAYQQFSSWGYWFDSIVPELQ